MLPDVSRERLLEAMGTFDKELRGTGAWANWEQKGPHKYTITHDGLRYPVKQIIRTATGETDFGEGYEANNYVEWPQMEAAKLLSPESADG
jgi:hypothetical protein